LANDAAGQIARDYLARRGVSAEAVQLFRLGYAPEAWDDTVNWGKSKDYEPALLERAGLILHKEGTDRYYDRFRGRLMFPICDRQGRVVAFSARLLKDRKNTGKYVNSPETDIFTKSRILYALDKAAAKIVKHPRREAIICEGQIDVIRCHSAGFETAVASQGTAFTKEHVSLLKKHADSVVLVFDGDSAGRKAALRTGALFLEEEVPVRVAVLPTGDDPDSIIRDKGPDVFRELLENAQSITTFQIDSLRQAETLPDSIDALNRVTRDVLDMLAACPGAVLRSRLLQEASALLHIPYSALEEDLEKHREALSRRAAVAASYKEAPAVAPPAPSQGTRPTDEPDSEERPPLSDDLEPDHEGDPEFEHLDEPAPEPPSHIEFLLCEFLVEHEHDADVLDLVERHLPLEVIPHPFARSVVETMLTHRHQGGDWLAELCKSTDSLWHSQLGNLLANKQKMLSAREMTKEEGIQGIITRLWVLQLKRIRGNLDSESTTENDARRLTLSKRINQLTAGPWEQVCKLMTASGSAAVRPAALPDAQALSGPAGAAGAAPYGHGGDSASGAADPEEFPPSEYPPDER
jgi:DNA primase catalytic core